MPESRINKDAHCLQIHYEEAPTQIFFFEFSEIFSNSCFVEHLDGCSWSNVKSDFGSSVDYNRANKNDQKFCINNTTSTNFEQVNNGREEADLTPTEEWMFWKYKQNN